MTLLRLAMGAAERGLRAIVEEGTQQRAVDEMQTRARLYELIDYEAYGAFDDNVYNFSLDPGGD